MTPPSSVHASVLDEIGLRHPSVGIVSGYLQANTRQRKVILATAIAETLLTLDGITAVVDAGLARVPRYDLGARLTRLATVRS